MVGAAKRIQISNQNHHQEMLSWTFYWSRLFRSFILGESRRFAHRRSERNVSALQGSLRAGGTTQNGPIHTLDETYDMSEDELEELLKKLDDADNVAVGLESRLDDLLGNLEGMIKGFGSQSTRDEGDSLSPNDNTILHKDSKA